MESKSYCPGCKRHYATPAALDFHVKEIHGGNIDDPPITVQASKKNSAQQEEEDKFLHLDHPITPKRFYCDFCALLCNSSAHLEISTWHGTVDYYD